MRAGRKGQSHGGLVLGPGGILEALGAALEGMTIDELLMEYFISFFCAGPVCTIGGPFWGHLGAIMGYLATPWGLLGLCRVVLVPGLRV